MVGEKCKPLRNHETVAERRCHLGADLHEPKEPGIRSCTYPVVHIWIHAR